MSVFLTMRSLTTFQKLHNIVQMMYSANPYPDVSGWTSSLEVANAKAKYMEDIEPHTYYLMDDLHLR